MSYFDTPESPLADAIEAIIGVNPGVEHDVCNETPSHYHGDGIPMQGVYHSNDLSETDQWALSDFCAYFGGNSEKASWLTGDSVLEMAELAVERAVANDNIDDNRHGHDDSVTCGKWWSENGFG